MADSPFDRYEELINLYHRLEKLDIESSDQRLRRLETAHSTQDPAGASGSWTCNAAAQVSEQVNALGEEYNNLEDAIHKLEVADGEKGKRLSELEQFVSERKVDHTGGQDPVKKVETASAFGPISASGEGASSASHRMPIHHGAIEPVTQQSQQFMASSSQSLSAFSTHEVAQDLLRRLGNGEELDPIVHRQLQATLFNPQDGLPLTPAVTDASKRPTTANGTPGVEPAPKRRPGRPPKHRLSGTSEDEPLPKRPRGRPPKHGRRFYGSSMDSSNPRFSVSSSSPSSSIPVIPGVNNAVIEKERASRDPSTATKAKIIQAVEDDIEVLETQFEAVEPASLDSDAPLRPKANRNRRIIASTDSSIEGPVKEVTDKNNAADASKSGGKVTPQPKHPDDPDVDKGTEISADQLMTAIERHNRAARSSPLDVNSPFADEERVDIPGERRSQRTPKRPTPFGDVLSWKEANLQMQGLKPEAPKK